MKKSLLFGAAALLALSANAQTLTKVWEHSMADHTTGETRSIGALGEYALVPNKTTGKVEVWGENGLVKEYDVNTWAAENDVKASPDAENVLGLGCAISTDEAGNIIVNLGFPNMPTSKNFVAIQPDGTMSHIQCEYPANVVVPETTGAGRMDYLGDKTAGDVMNLGYIIVCPQALDCAICYCIYEGEFDNSAYTYTVKLGDADNTETWNSESTAIPLASLAEGAEQAPKFIAHNRSIAGYRISADGKEAMQKLFYGEGKDATVFGFDGTSTNFSAFVVGGETYVVHVYCDAELGDGYKRTNFFEIKRMSDGQVVAYQAPAEQETVNYMLGLASSVNEDGTVNIYQYNPGLRLAKYIFNPTGAGVEGAIADDVNAPVKYYNLQGVEIANPENGLFIKKQGAKATKVVL